MRLMGIAALGPKPRTTKPAPGHEIYPYLLRDLVIDRPNQVWAADITFIPSPARIGLNSKAYSNGCFQPLVRRQEMLSRDAKRPCVCRRLW